jgi:hypothetical protein
MKINAKKGIILMMKYVCKMDLLVLCVKSVILYKITQKMNQATAFNAKINNKI